MTDREWREASDLRPSRLGLAAVLLTAMALRLYALENGIPYNLEVDEPEIQERAVNMMKTGSLNPHGFFDYPTLYIYTETGVATVRFVIGAVTGQWAALDQARTEDFYIWARATTAVFGVVTVLLLFHIGMRWGARHALLAAGLLAVLPLHVRQSHYVLTDVPLTFFVTLTLLFSLRANERGTAAAFAWAGAAAGLAAATKYNGGIALLLPLLTCFMTPGARPSRLRCAMLTICGCLAAFLIAAPYSLLDLPGFLNGFARLANEYRTKPFPPEPGWILYLKYLRGGLGWPALILTLIGLGLAINRLIRGPGRSRWALITIFPLLYYFYISDQRLVFGRYLLPIMPLLCLLVATAVISGVSLLRRFEIPRAPRTALIAAGTIAALLPPALQSVSYAREIGRVSTVRLARDWVVDHLPEGSKVVVETRALLLDGRRYRVANIPQLIADPLSHAAREHSDYVGAGIEYVIASGQAYGPVMAASHKHPEEYARYMRLFEQSQELIRFTPDARHPGPELRIYKLR